MTARWKWAAAVAIAAGAGVMALPGTSIGRFLPRGWSYTESVTQDRGQFYRMKVNLAYRGTPVAFDIVVGCNVRRTRYRDGDSSYEAGFIPALYGRKMPDGKTVTIASPNACEGQTTANGKVPADFLPLIIVYQDETTAFGIAYVTEEAYSNPLSELRFDKATIEAATAKEFAAFRRNGPPNALSRDAYHSSTTSGEQVLARLGAKRVRPSLGVDCGYTMRLLVPEKQRAELRAAWPASKPTYWLGWTPKFGEIGITDFQREASGRSVRLETWSGAVQRARDHGVPRRHGWGDIWPRPSPTGRDIPLVYPTYTDSSGHAWPRDPSQWLSFLEAHKTYIGFKVDAQAGKTAGFAYCTSTPFISPENVFRVWREIKGLRLFEQQPIFGATLSPFREGVKFYQRDEFVFTSDSISLTSLRGDL